MSVRPQARKRFLTAGAAFAAVAALVATSPATGSSAAAPTATTSTGSGSTQGYTPGSRDDAQNAQLTAQLNASLKRQSKGAASSLAVTTVYYDTSQAPSFRSTINQAAAIWNSSVTNVRLVARSSASLRYYEGNDSRGSYYSGNGHGSGYMLIDYRQAQQYSPLRIIAHETGHALGLPDHYSGPCSELMSGGGPGPSCTNAYPNATERSRVNTIWRYGIAAYDASAAFAPATPTLAGAR